MAFHSSNNTAVEEKGAFCSNTEEFGPDLL